MFSINDNEENSLLVLLDNSLEDPYYLFYMENLFSCEAETMILQPDSDCDGVKTFTIDHEFENAGIYKVRIYEQESYSNEDPDLATLLLTTKFLVRKTYCEL